MWDMALSCRDYDYLLEIKIATGDTSRGTARRLKSAWHESHWLTDADVYEDHGLSECLVQEIIICCRFVFGGITDAATNHPQ